MTTKKSGKKKGIPGPLPVDPPIIVQGGGSIEMNLPPNFAAQQTGPGGGKHFKHNLGKLTTLVIDDPPTTVTLKPNSKITINYA